MCERKEGRKKDKEVPDFAVWLKDIKRTLEVKGHLPVYISSGKKHDMD